MALAQSVLGSAQAIVAVQRSVGITQSGGRAERVQLFSGSRTLEQGAESGSALSASWRGAEESRRRVVQCRATVYKVEMIHEAFDCNEVLCNQPALKVFSRRGA